MSTFERIAGLPVEIEGYSLERLEQDVSSEFTRVTTVIRLRGGSEEGIGEDVTYDAEDHDVFQQDGASLELAGRHGSLDGLSRRLGELELFPRPPVRPHSVAHRRWAFESAALDLALRQAGTTLHEARCALEAHAIANGDAPEVASHRDLGAFQLLLSLQDDEALRLYCDNLLAPLERSGGDYGGELIRSLEAFIEHNGQWERAAREVYCHRHTLRYRMRKVEELTGRDLSRAHDRIEFWLALRGRELVK